MNEKKFWPCEHIDKQIEDGPWIWQRGKNLVEDKILFCSFCGAQRPEPSDGLDEIFDKHRNKYTSGKEWQREISKDLREWKEKGTVPFMDVKPEESKKLWLFLNDELHKKFKLDKPFWQPKVQGESFWREAAGIALDWFEKILPKPLEGSIGWNTCLEEIRQRLVEEKEELYRD